MSGVSAARVEVFPAAEFASEAAAWIASLASAAVAERGAFHIALAGGSTPRTVYQALAHSELEFGHWQFFFGDERWVSHDQPESNYRMASEALLGPADIDGAQVHAYNTALPDPHDAARAYERGLIERLAAGDGPPSFDLILLGLGTDGHTASLFPGTDALEVKDRWVAANPVPQLSTTRLTLTYPTLHAAQRVAFLVTGHGKASVLRSVLAPGSQAPAARVTGDQVTWLVDTDTQT